MGVGPLLASRPQRRAALVVGVVLGAAGFLPLLGGPGYEHALASGLLVPGAAALATSEEIAAPSPPPPLACAGRGVLSGLALAGVAFATALVHGALRGFCDLPGGALGFALTAGFGAVLGGVWGALVGEVLRGRRARLVRLAAISAPLGGIAISVGRFYSSPMVFAFDPFVGYFGGTLYDTVIDAGTALWTYRLGSLGSLLAVIFAASVCGRDARGRPRLLPLRGHGGNAARAGLAALALGVSVTVTARGAELGHWETSASIAAALGGARSGARCDVVMPDSVLPDDAALLVKDCDEELEAVERALGAKGPPRVRAFFFRDAAEKKRLMGAGDTYIAKPWRHEVYLQLGGYPHPILGHELAHVVAGSFGRGPFKVAGRAAGLWPNPGLIEGVAVAASPDDEELTDEEWSHAMLDLGVLPEARSVFSFDFLASSAAKSYTVAGAFVRFAIDRFGAETVRAWYGGASIEALTGKSWSELDALFRAAIAAIPLSPEATAYAKARFERAAVFGRTCPHVVDGLRQEADRCRDAHEVDRAVTLYDDVLARDPRDWGARFERAMTLVRFGDEAAGRRGLDALAGDPDEPRTWRDRTRDALGDEAMRARDLPRAAAIYDVLAATSLDEDFARMEDVKSIAAKEDDARAPIEALLIGSGPRGGDFALAASLLGAWEARAGSPLASFLLGKNLSQRGDRAEGAAHLDRLLDGGVYPTPRVGREAIRDRAIDACAAGDAAAVARMKALTLDPAGPYARSRGRKAAVLRLLDRCARAP